MRISLAVSDELLAAARRRARERGQTLEQVVEAALRRELADSGADAARVPVFRGGTGPRPGLDVTSNRALFEALDEPREQNERG